MKKVIVIGGGPGGYAAGIYCAKLGHAVTLVENAQMGGTCLNRGCIPTKAFLRPAGLYRELANAAAWGLKAGEVEYTFAKTLKMKNKIVKQLRGGVEFLLNKNGVQVMQGRGSLVPGGVRVETADGGSETLTADAIILATGSSEVVLPGFEPDGVHILNSTHMLDIEQLPESLLIIGGGVIGVEFASVMQGFGKKVTIVEFMNRLLPTEDKDISELLCRSLKAQGVEVYTSARATRVLEKSPEVAIEVEQNGEAQTLRAEKLLVCVGRRANLEGIGLAEAGVEFGKTIPTDSQMRTNLPHIYAVGDITASPQLAHVAYQEALVAAKSINGTPEDIDYTAIPGCIFSHPEVASVGLSQQAAEAAFGEDAATVTESFSGNGKAMIEQENEGIVKYVYKKSGGTLLGCSILGPKATELITEPALAVRWGLPLGKVAGTIHAHPTLSELLGETAAVPQGLGLHTL